MVQMAKNYKVVSSGSDADADADVYDRTHRHGHRAAVGHPPVENRRYRHNDIVGGVTNMPVVMHKSIGQGGGNSGRHRFMTSKLMMRRESALHRILNKIKIMAAALRVMLPY